MDEVFTFLIKHWILSSAFIVILIAFLINELLQVRFGLKQISSEEAVQIINHQDGVILDIRSEKNFAEGHILGSHNLPSQQFEHKLNSLQKWKNKPIIVVCAMGQEAQKITDKLKAAGFNAVVLKEGIQGWRTSGLPVVKK